MRREADVYDEGSSIKMANELKAKVQELAAAFVDGVVEAVRATVSGNLEVAASAVASPAKRRGRPPGSGKKAAAAKPAKAAAAKTGTRVRRSVDDISGTADKVVVLVAKHPEGVRMEQIRTSLGLDSKDLLRPIKWALENHLLKTTGQKRATTYHLGKKAANAANGTNGTAGHAKPAPVKRGRKPKAKAEESTPPVEADDVAVAADGDDDEEEQGLTENELTDEEKEVLGITA